MFRIKICGITNLADAHAAVDAGADALGFNFYPASKRFVGYDEAWQMAKLLPDHILKVGVFVNRDVREIQEVAPRLQLDYIQLHGDEPPAILRDLPTSIGVVRAFRCAADGLGPLASYLRECDIQGRAPDVFLLDACVAGEFGGTGHMADWSLIADERDKLDNMPFALAGGLTPENVGRAIAAVRPHAVDVAGGVERKPGVKDADLMNQFVAAARTAFNRI